MGLCPTLSVAGGGEQGYVDPCENPKFFYDPGQGVNGGTERVTLKAIASCGYHFKEWSGAGSCYPGSSSTAVSLQGCENPIITLVMNKKREVAPVFEIATLEIQSQTVKTQPPDTARRTIGVGEEVDLTITGYTGSGSISWSLIGGGVLAVTGHNEARFTAPDRASTAEITALSCTQRSLDTIIFSVIEPSGVLFENNLGPEGWSPPTHNFIGLNFSAKVYVQPDTVNFYRIRLYESHAIAYTSGYFAARQPPLTPHDPNGGHVIAGYEAGKGSKMLQDDSIWGVGGPPPYPTETSTAIWPIVWSYDIEGGTTKDIELVNQTFTLVGQGGNVATFTITKDQAGASISTGGTAHFITP